jgi:flavin-dependent dehydrogenase
VTAAVVLGGGFAGVLAAAVLARHADEVVLAERGRYPQGPDLRAGLPQAHHNHVLVTAGARALDELLPGTTAELLARGAHRRGLPDGALILSAQGWFRRCETDAYLLACSRWLTDHVVRGRALAAGSVTVLEETRAVALTGDAHRVTGVLLRHRDGRTRALRADLVVDAAGRASQAPRWLAGLGAPAVDQEVVDPGLAYATRVYRAPADIAAAIPAVMIHPRFGGDRPALGATLFPIEGGRWIATLTGTRGCDPPDGPDGFASGVRALASPVMARLLDAAEPLGGVRMYRGTANRRRYFEHAALPDGFLALGDATVAVNPVHSHGMSVAALSALRLDVELARHGADPAALPKVQSALAEVADRSWRMATDQDRPLAVPPLSVPRRRAAPLSRHLLGSQPLMAELFRAQTLLPPSTNAETRAVLLRELARSPEPPLTDDAAVAQFPALAR